MPGRDLVPPAHDGAPGRAHFGWAGLLLEIDAELTGELRVSDPVDRTDDFPGVPGQAHLAALIEALAREGHGPSRREATWRYQM